jgi:hypothetical protein
VAKRKQLLAATDASSLPLIDQAIGVPSFAHAGDLNATAKFTWLDRSPSNSFHSQARIIIAHLLNPLASPLSD